MALTYQALTDLLNLPDKTLNAQSIKGGIDINTQITLTYRANDFETAEWLASLTGKAQKTVTKMEKVEVNKGGAEVWGDERSVGQVEETTVTTNQLLALPARVSALIRPNHLAVIIYTCWINVKEFKGLPPRNAAQPPNPQAIIAPAAATALTPTSEVVEDDPFASSLAATDDPFASLENHTEDDPFAALASAEDDPFSSIDTNDITGPSDDPFAQTTADEDERFTPEPLPQKPAGKAKLTADQLAAIEAAGLAITSPRPPKPKPAAPVDLSSLDDIEGI